MLIYADDYARLRIYALRPSGAYEHMRVLAHVWCYVSLRRYTPTTRRTYNVYELWAVHMYDDYTPTHMPYTLTSICDCATIRNALGGRGATTGEGRGWLLLGTGETRGPEINRFEVGSQLALRHSALAESSGVGS